MIVPLFPLPNAFLFPGGIMPLHIFEPRYRRMTEDLLDTAGRLVIANVVGGEDADLDGSPSVHRIAGLGEIGGHERLPDGRYLIALLGLCRVTLDEVESEHPYRMVKAEPMVEVFPDADEDTTLRGDLHRELLRLSGSDGESVPKDLPLARLVDALLLQLQIDPADMQTVFENPDVGGRARTALELAAGSDIA